MFIPIIARLKREHKGDAVFFGYVIYLRDKWQNMLCVDGFFVLHRTSFHPQVIHITVLCSARALPHLRMDIPQCLSTTELIDGKRQLVASLA